MLRLRRDEQVGSIIIAIGIISVISLLAAALVSRNIGATKQGRTGQDFAAALASADGGLADALFKLDQEANPLNMPNVIEGSGSLPSGSTFSYRGTKVDAETYRFQARGIVNKVPHAVEALVVRSLRWPYAIFANQSLTFNGNGVDTITSAPEGGLARVGSNGPINVNSGSGAGDFQDYYTPGGSCSGCPNGVLKEGPLLFPDPTVPTGSTRPCPSGGIFSGTITGGDPFVCNQDVTIRTSSVSPVAGKGVEIYIYANRRLTMSDGGGAKAEINKGGLAANLVINKAGTGSIDIGTGSNAVDFTGVLYAPSSGLVTNGHPSFFGSVMVNSLTTNGAPNFKFTWDSNLRPVVDRNWRVRFWRQVPSSSVSVP